MSRETGQGERRKTCFPSEKRNERKEPEDRKTEKGDENVVLTELSADSSSDKRKE